MTNLIIITARKNSKRLKNKNILKIGKKNLVERSIEFALKVEKKYNIFMSTDSLRIKKIAKKYNIICPSLRPKKLSSNKATSEDATIHAVNLFEKLMKVKVTTIVLLQPTSPFRSMSIYNKTLKIFNKNNLPTITVSKISPINLKNKIIFSSKKQIKMVKKINNHYFTNGNLYMIRKKDLFKKKTFIPKKFNMSVINSEKYSLDIDTIYDLEKAKSFL